MISCHVLALQCHFTTVTNLKPQKEYLPTVIALTAVISNFILFLNKRKLQQRLFYSIAIQQFGAVFKCIRCDNIFAIMDILFRG